MAVTVQVSSVRRDGDATAEKACRLIGKAASSGARSSFHAGLIDAPMRHLAFENGVWAVSVTCVWDLLRLVSAKGFETAGTRSASHSRDPPGADADAPRKDP